MSQQLQTQFTAWWQLVLSNETGLIYKNFVVRTWEIIKETAILLWLLVCFVFVAISWIWTGSSKTVDNFQTWQSQVSEKEDSTLLSEAGQSIWDATQKTTAAALQAARSQLGMHPPETSDSDTPTTPIPAAKPAAVQPAPMSPPPAAATPAPPPTAATPAPPPAATPAPPPDSNVWPPPSDTP